MANFNVILNKKSSSRKSDGKIIAELLNLTFEYGEYSDAYESYRDKIVRAASHNGAISFTLIEETIYLIDKNGVIDSSLTLSNNVKL